MPENKRKNKESTGWHKKENMLQLEPKKTDIEIVEIERKLRCIDFLNKVKK